MQDTELIKAIVRYQSQINDKMVKERRRIAQKNGLPLEQYRLLIQLKEIIDDYKVYDTDPTVGHIAKVIKKSQNSISEIITRLENKELLSRCRDKKDRRISRVSITKRGIELLHTIKNETENRLLEESLQKLTNDEIHQLCNCLKKLINNMDI